MTKLHRNSSFPRTALFALTISAFCSPVQAQTDTFDIRADWEIFFDFLQEKHPNPFFSTPQKLFEAKQAWFLKTAPELTRAEQIVQLAQLVALTGDGHTFLPMHPLPFDGFPPGPEFHALPVRFELFDDGLFIVGASEDYENLVGGEVINIGSVTTDVALQRVMSMLPKDAINFSRDFAPEWLMLSEVLSALDVTVDPKIAEITVLKEQNVVSASIKPLAPEQRYDWIFGMDSGPSTPEGTHNHWRRSARNTPMWRETFTAPFRLKHIHRNTLYFQINELRDGVDMTIRNTTRDLIRKSTKHSNAIIIDLRRCIGGDGSLIPGMMAELDQINPNTPIAVITSRKTHSAGVMLVSALEQKTNAVFIGQATADRPNHYGETNIFVLPDSQLPVIHASEYYQTSTPSDARAFKTPDIVVPYLFADYARGFDRTLGAALDHINRK